MRQFRYSESVHNVDGSRKGAKPAFAEAAPRRQARKGKSWRMRTKQSTADFMDKHYLNTRTDPVTGFASGHPYT